MQSKGKYIIFVVLTLIIINQIMAEEESLYNKTWVDFNKNGKKEIYENQKKTDSERIDDLISRMNLKEKTCQLATLYGYGNFLDDQLPKKNWKNEIWKDGIGNIDEHLNSVYYKKQSEYSYPHSKHPKAINEVQKWFVEETRLGIPVDFSNEGIRGLCHKKATGFPAQIALGCTFNKNLIKKIGHITAEEGKSLGYTNIYSPILDVERDPRWGRMVESFGESPYLVGELGKEMVSAIQSHNIVSTSKHFAAYSIPKGGRDAKSRTNPQLASREMRSLLLHPFKKAIKDAGGRGVMSSYNGYNGIPITGSYKFLTKILRDEWNFDGYVVSDSRAVGFINEKHQTAETYKEAVYQAVKAGLNVRTEFNTPEEFIIPLRELVREGTISEDLIDSRVRDVLRNKFWLGLFDSPYVDNPKKADSIVGNSTHQKVSLQTSRESIVLLKNEGLLPLEKSNVDTILITGPNAKEENYAISRYGPSGINVINVLEGIHKVAGKSVEILYEKGCNLRSEHYPQSEVMDFPISNAEKKRIDNAVKKARKADIIIAAMGENEYIVGEGRTRTSLDLPGNQTRLLKELHKTGKPIAMVMINGRPLTVNWADKNISAIIETMFPGPYGGQAIGEVLFGEHNPSGKLSFTVPKTVGQIRYNFPHKKGSQNPPPMWGSRMGGKKSMVSEPLYPFGYGLSYTSFEYTNIVVEPKTQTSDKKIKIKCKIKNTGDTKGAEVVQLYLKDRFSSVITYEKQLRGFKKVSLEPGETESIKFILKPEDLQILDKNMKWSVEPGKFIVQLGSSSKDIRLKENFTIKKRL